ncbi:MAG: enoyl-CoA hydratase/isomerase family protein [Candidatus Zixiibacteriota bacterium]
MAEETLQIERHGPIMEVRLNRPHAGNAVDLPMMTALESAVQRWDADPGVRVVIVTGAGGRTFCTGGDLHYFATLKTRDSALAMSERMTGILERLGGTRRVVIGAVNGQALGGGCEILTACHMRIAASTATFRFLHAEKGLIPGWGGGLRLLRIIGRSRALRLLLTTETIDAHEAHRIGFVDSVVEPEQLIGVAHQLARRISEVPQDVVAAHLELLARVDAGDLAGARVHERESFATLWMGDAFRRSIEAFVRPKGD